MRTFNQRLHAGWIARCVAAALMISIGAGSARPQDARRASIIVQVFDDQGGVIIGARTTLTDTTGRETSGITNGEGKSIFSDLPLGSYAIRIAAQHFRTHQDERIQLKGQDVSLNVTLHIAGVEESIAVFPDTSLGQVAEYIGGSLVIRGDALAAVDGPGGLEAFLRALALRTGSPFGPTPLINGFEDGQLPPTYSIREIRINDNPFSAEYATLGLGRIEILTKPGTEQWHAAVFTNFGDAKLNSRNPFAPDKVHYDSRFYGGNISGPVAQKQVAFFVDFTKQQVDTNAVINATVLDSLSRIVPLQQAVVTPQFGS